jgi:MFS family permease
MVLLGPLGGVLVDKLHRRYKNARPWGLTVVALLASIFALLQVLAIGAPLALFLGFGAVVTFLMAVFIPIMLSLGQDIMPVGLRSSAGGVFNFVAQVVGSAVSPIIAGAISDASGGGAHGIQVGILWMTPMAFLGIISGLLLLKFYASDSAKVSDEVIAEK